MVCLSRRSNTSPARRPPSNGNRSSVVGEWAGGARSAGPNCPDFVQQHGRLPTPSDRMVEGIAMSVVAEMCRSRKFHLLVLPSLLECPPAVAPIEPLREDVCGLATFLRPSKVILVEALLA